MGKINGLINIIDLFNLIRLLNYKIWNNYYLSNLSYCGIYNNYLSDVVIVLFILMILVNYEIWNRVVHKSVVRIKISIK